MKTRKSKDKRILEKQKQVLPPSRIAKRKPLLSATGKSIGVVANQPSTSNGVDFVSRFVWQGTLDKLKNPLASR